MSNSEVPRRRRSSRRKVSVPEDEEEVINLVEAKPKGKRGRKKRVVAVLEQPVLDQSSGDEESVAKKPRRSARRSKKPQVKDLSIALGLEHAPPRLGKGDRREIPDDELLENRIDDEVRKVTNLEEVMLRTAEAHGVSDDENQGLDGEGISGESDVDDEDNLGCPRPLPLWNRTEKSKTGDIKSQVVDDKEFNEMCLVIKRSMRQPLTVNLDSCNDDFVLPHFDFEEDEENGDQPKEIAPSNFTIYNRFRRILGMEEEVASNLTKEFEKSPIVFCSKISAHNLEKNLSSKSSNFHRQLFFEHLSWLAIAASGANNGVRPAVQLNGALAWLPGFRQKFLYRLPELAQDASPNSGSRLNSLLRTSTTKALLLVDEVTKNLLVTRKALKLLIDHIEKTTDAKRAICNEFTELHQNLNSRDPKLDETSVWGLKPLRLALEPPYFKSSDGLMAFPMTPDAEYRAKHFAKCFFKRDKQKWTTKDLNQLKVCIREVLVTKRLNAIKDRHSMLMTDCRENYEIQLAEEAREDAELLDSHTKRTGRPKKSELEVSKKYAVAKAFAGGIPGGPVYSIVVNPESLSRWRTEEEKKLRERSYEELVYLENEVIDWEFVANKMIMKSRKQRTAEDCELAWRHEVHPSVNEKKWNLDDTKKLKDVYDEVGNDWETVAMRVNEMTSIAYLPGRTPYQCYFRIRNRLYPPKKLTWTAEMDKLVLNKLEENPGNWRLVAASIDNPAATKRQVIERYKKTINPVLRNGAFTRVEDCLLILTIEKLKPFLGREGHFGCLLAYLPWRCETTWRDRANNLFSDWIVPWTLEEDKMLLTLAETMNRNWQKISEEFTSFKNRKGCLTRFKILNKRLKDKRFDNSLEAYHEAYAMTRYNVFQYKHLKEILELLTRVRDKPLPPELREFPGLVRDREPSEVRLQYMLLTFDKNILDAAIKSLIHYIHTRDEYWRNWISKHGKRKRTFDRRTFHKDCPQSVASALHIRGLKLKPRNDIANINDFESEIYKFYGRFCRTKALKEDADRPYIPDAKTLAQWSAVSRLVITPVDQLEDVPLKRKWKTLKGGALQSNNPSKKRSYSRRSLRTIGSEDEEEAVNSPPGSPPLQLPIPGSLEVEDTNENGYLIPIDMMKKRVRRGRPRKTEEQLDPEFTLGLSVAEGNVVPPRQLSDVTPGPSTSRLTSNSSDFVKDTKYVMVPPETIIPQFPPRMADQDTEFNGGKPATVSPGGGPEETNVRRSGRMKGKPRHVFDFDDEDF